MATHPPTGEPADGPRVLIEPTSHEVGAAPNQWLVSWRIRNLGPLPLRLEAARLPHGRFRHEERALDPAPTLWPQEAAELALAVACGEAPGTVVENAFLILRVRWGAEPWRILARLAAVFDQHGALRTTCETITTHPIGFSR